MPNSAEFIDELADRFGPLGAIRAKSMFGGHGIYCDERFFCIVSDDVPYFKVNDATRPRYEDAGVGPFYPGDKPMRGYYQVPDEVPEGHDRLLEWATEAIDVAREAKT